MQKDTVLFRDARNTFTQIDRAHREFNLEQLEFLANIVRLYRGRSVETHNDDSLKMLKQHFPKLKYIDIAGLCRSVSLKEIEKQGWSLNPGRYVGVTEKEDDGVDFKGRLKELDAELETLNDQAHNLEKLIRKNLPTLLK